MQGRVAQAAHLAGIVHRGPGTMFAMFQLELCSQLTRSAVTGCREYSLPVCCLSGKEQRKGTPCQRYPQPCSNSRREGMCWPHLTTAPLEHLHIETGPYRSGWIMSGMQLILLHCRTEHSLTIPCFWTTNREIMHLIIYKHCSDVVHISFPCRLVYFWKFFFLYRTIYLLQHPLGV